MGELCDAPAHLSHCHETVNTPSADIGWKRISATEVEILETYVKTTLGGGNVEIHWSFVSPKLQVVACHKYDSWRLEPRMT